MNRSASSLSLPLSESSQNLACTVSTPHALLTSPNISQLTLPIYQRGYAWNGQQTELLLLDIAASLNKSPPRPHFLGSIIIACSDNQLRSYLIIDGQQRITTIIIILSVIRYMISSQCAEKYRVIDEWITGFPKTTKRDDPFHYKFFLRERNSERTLFRRFISDPEGMQELLHPNFSPLRYSIDPTSFTLKLRSVSQSVHNRLSELYAKHCETNFAPNKTTLVDFLFKFALFLMNDTQLVILEPDTLSNAYVIFRTLNARGVRLNLLDNLKASLFAKLQDRLDASDSRASTRYLEKWERCENMLTTGHGDSGENFKLLFEYMLRIHSAMDNTMTLGDKTALFIKKSVQFDDPLFPETSNIYRFVLEGNLDTKQFIDDWLVPYAAIFCNLMDHTASFKRYPNIIRSLRFLNLLEKKYEKYWLPLVMSILRKFTVEFNSHLVTNFLHKIENLFAYLCLFAKRRDENQIATRTIYILEKLSIPDEDTMSSARRSKLEGMILESLTLEKDEKKSLVESFSRDVYGSRTNVARYLLLRINEQLVGRGVVYDYTDAEIEHVCPQNPQDRSEWVKTWTDRYRLSCIDIIGNLVLLRKDHNKHCSNKEWAIKRKAYLSDRNHQITPFAITITVCKENERWTPLECLKTQKKWLTILGSIYSIEKEMKRELDYLDERIRYLDRKMQNQPSTEREVYEIEDSSDEDTSQSDTIQSAMELILSENNSSLPNSGNTSDINESESGITIKRKRLAETIQKAVKRACSLGVSNVSAMEPSELSVEDTIRNPNPDSSSLQNSSSALPQNISKRFCSILIVEDPPDVSIPNICGNSVSTKERNCGQCHYVMDGERCIGKLIDNEGSVPFCPLHNGVN